MHDLNRLTYLFITNADGPRKLPPLNAYILLIILAGKRAEEETT